MCGIAGIIAKNNINYQTLIEIANAMASTLLHRGPDAHGVWGDPQYSIALSHRRLSIQDLSSAGHQPMSSNSGRFFIVFNGEIYNFRTLAEELRQLGHQFRGHSDTEVLLAAFEEWGIGVTLQRSRGMFAMAIWDRQSCELILCRDRLGEKPLFFGWINKCFVFASELKAFRNVFNGALIIDDNALAAYFRYGYVPTPHSIFKNIFKLLPGTYLRIPLPLPDVSEFNPLPDKNFLSPQPYWNVETIARQGLNNLILDEHEAISILDSLLRDAIGHQKIADVPIGAFLSGGVDSSLVAAVMQAIADKPISTFTIGFKEKEFDEAPYARAVAQYIGSDHQEYYVSANDGLALVEDIPRYCDEPFADSSQIPSMFVAKMARQKVTVCLTGDGGDELFCGYNRYFACANILSLQKRVPYFLRKLVGKSIATIPPRVWQDSYLLYKRLMHDKHTQANVGLKVHKLAALIRMNSKYEAYRFLMSYWQEPGDILKYSREVTSILDRDSSPMLGNFINDAMYWDQLGYLIDDNLVKGDRSSMAYGLETRLPLLDHRIVEFSWRLPLAMKFRNGKSKWLLRQVLNRYVPKNLIERPKMGFTVPVGDWLRGPLKSWAGDLLHSESSSCVGVLNEINIQRVWKEHQNSSHDHSHKLWALCMWLAWVEQKY